MKIEISENKKTITIFQFTNRKLNNFEKIYSQIPPIISITLFVLIRLKTLDTNQVLHFEYIANSQN